MTSLQKKNKKRQAWRHFTSKYWKKRAGELGSWLIYSPYNLSRMAMGKAPRRLALLRHKTTFEVIEFHAPVELHHVFGHSSEAPQEDQTIVELYPWQHSECDPDRKFPYEFVQWVGFQ